MRKKVHGFGWRVARGAWSADRRCADSGGVWLAALLLGLTLELGWAAGPPPRPAEPAFPAPPPAENAVASTPTVIVLPTNPSPPAFIDYDGDGLADLLVIDASAKELLVYRQRSNGFPHDPDQVLGLPPQTVWVSLLEVDVHPGRELLFSTATGLVYSWQTAGRFEAEQRPLIHASQVFTNSDYPYVAYGLSTNRVGTNGFIPVISDDHAVVYRRGTNAAWQPEPPLPLKLIRSSWGLDSDPRLPDWTLGAAPGRRVRAAQFFRAKPEPRLKEAPETEVLRRLVGEMNKTPAASPPIIERLDVDGDGQEDALVWQGGGKNPLEFKTDIYVFLRGADHQLPARPSQTLHARGLPIPLGNTTTWSPMGRLKGDGSPQVVLLEFNTRFATASGLLDTAISHGLNWLLTVRPFRNGYFSASPEASVPVKLMAPYTVLTGWNIFITGDFNADGRPELLIRRSDTQWQVFFSTADGSWFNPQPALKFEAAARGYPEIRDLNADGRADILWHEPEAHRLSVFLTPPARGNAQHP